jgi:hypothetical protein
MSTLKHFPRESMNFQRGSDDLEGGESSGVARLGFALLDFVSPTRIEQEERRGGSNGWNGEDEP